MCNFKCLIAGSLEGLRGLRRGVARAGGACKQALYVQPVLVAGTAVLHPYTKSPPPSAAPLPPTPGHKRVPAAALPGSPP
eukprot:68874-Chlamydomonas_euryale.AAC.5